MIENPLGKKINFISNYDASLLFAIPRGINRAKIGIDEPFFGGFDVWNCYEFSYLNEKGKPITKVLKIVCPADSENIVESKSLKLYLTSFSMTTFEHQDDVLEVIKNDLSKILNTRYIKLFFDTKDKFKYTTIPHNKLIDKLDVDIKEYNLNPSILQVTENKKGKTIEKYSTLLKTNCPITNQPDYGVVYIKYKSDFMITDESLLKYIVSFRQYSDYHESCCEKIFFDIFNLIKPEFLVVKCFYTRRGGIDINPQRFFPDTENEDFYFHYWRQ